MIKPEHIPQDIWDAVLSSARPEIVPFTAADVCRLVIAEREACAEIAVGEVYHNERFRTWPWWKPQPDGTRGNRSNESDIVRHADDIAAAIRNRGEARS